MKKILIQTIKEVNYSGLIMPIRNKVVQLRFYLKSQKYIIGKMFLETI